MSKLAALVVGAVAHLGVVFAHLRFVLGRLSTVRKVWNLKLPVGPVQFWMGVAALVVSGLTVTVFVVWFGLPLLGELVNCVVPFLLLHFN